jgi:hypothetical protein
VVEVEITREGLRHLNQLPGKVRDAAIQAILGSIAERPRRPTSNTPLPASRYFRLPASRNAGVALATMPWPGPGAILMTRERHQTQRRAPVAPAVAGR